MSFSLKIALSSISYLGKKKKENFAACPALVDTQEPGETCRTYF